MAKKSREQLLAEAKKRQAARDRARKKTQELQKSIPRKIPGVPAWATALARSPIASDVSSLAFGKRAHDALLIEALEQMGTGTPSIGSVSAPVARDIRDSVSPQDVQDLVRSLVQIDWGTGGDRPKRGPRGRGPIGPPKSRSPKQMMNDSIQSDALSTANKKARKKDGTFKKGWDQRRVMVLAQKECTKERERLGLCKRKKR